jgi:hypothetical protein
MEITTRTAWLHFAAASSLAVVILLVASLIFSPWHPPVGVYIAMLAVLGVCVPLIREKIGPNERAMWTALMFILVVLEINSIYKDRKEHDAQQARARKEQLEGFQRIGDGITAAIQDSDRNFNATLGRENILLDNINGGKTFCVVEAIPLGDKFLLAVIAVGPNPLHDVLIDQVDVDVMNAERATPNFDFDAIQGFTTHYPLIPFLVSSSGRQLAEIPTGSNKRNLRFSF